MIARAFLSQETDGKQMAAVNQTAAQTQTQSPDHRFLGLTDFLSSIWYAVFCLSKQLGCTEQVKNGEQSVMRCVCLAVSQRGKLMTDLFLSAETLSVNQHAFKSIVPEGTRGTDAERNR